MGSRNDQGQATVEHLGIVAMVALVMVSLGAIAAVAAPGLLNRVSGGFRHALCVVTGQACVQLADEPCPVRRQTDRSSQGVEVGWLRMGHDRVLFIERRSDGSYLLSLLEGGRAGAGIGRQVTGGGVDAAADADLTLGWKGGRQYVVTSPEEARALVRRLRADPLPALSTEVAAALDVTGLRDADAAVDAYVLSGDAAVEAVAKLGFNGILEGGAELGGRGEVGVKIAAHRKEVTTYAKVESNISVFLDAFAQTSVRRPARRRTAPAGADLTKPTRGPDLGKGAAPAPAAGIPVARNGRQVDLTSFRPLEGGAAASVALRFGPGPRLLGVEFVVSGKTADQQRELRVRMDPSDPEVGAAVEQWRLHPASVDALHRLGEVAADRAALDDRTFSLTDGKLPNGLPTVLEDALALAGKIGQAGLEMADERSIGELVDQRSKPSGGVWETRLDCVPANAA